MLWNTAHQLETLMIMAASGAAAGILYDALRVARERLEAGWWLSMAADLAFGAGAAALFIFFSLRASYGQVRLYQVAGFGAGFALYMGGFHEVVWCVGGGIRRAYRRVRECRYVRWVFR